MKPQFMIKVIAVVYSVIVPSYVLAAPIAQWIMPWDVTLSSKDERGDGKAARAFGTAATRDGQIRNTGTFNEMLPGTSAVAKSESSANSDLFSFSSGSTGVLFSRTFRLMDSPFGWNVTLNGILEGHISVENSRFDNTLDPFARVTADAIILTGFFQGTGIGISDSRVLELKPLQSDPGERMEDIFSHPLLDTGTLSDGTYTVIGSLFTDATVNRSTLFSSESNSDFFTDGETGFFTVGISASPRQVPEPSTLALLSISFLALFAVGGSGCGFRLKRRCQSDERPAQRF